MRKITIAAVTALAFAGLAACGESSADKAAETQADALEAQAAATPNEAEEKALNTQADRIEQQAGNADGGLTTNNTPSTTPSGEMTAPPAQPAH
jgi:basic membrane lipoprotein Med (substrate-binding protein (PBP1-ABC) superfamily)